MHLQQPGPFATQRVRQRVLDQHAGQDTVGATARMVGPGTGHRRQSKEVGYGAGLREAEEEDRREEDKAGLSDEEGWMK